MSSHPAHSPWSGSPRALRISDAAMVFVAMFSANVVRFRLDPHVLHIDQTALNYWVVTVVISVFWWLFLEVWGSREPKTLGHGAEEYKRVGSASAWLFGSIAVFSYLTNTDTSRGYVGIALPVGLALLLISRWLWRRTLIAARNRGEQSHRVMLLGGPGSVRHLHDSLRNTPGAGYLPIVAYLPGYSKTSPDGDELPLPVAGTSLNVDDILKAILDYNLDAVAISSGAALSPRSIRRLGWELHDREINLIMAPALTDVAGPRIHTQPIAGLPLIHVSTPKLSGVRSFLKRTFDLVLAVTAAIVVSPILLITAIAVRLDSKGPILFHQIRVGKGGKTFQMYKFRSMVTDAEARLAKLKNQTDAGNEVLFKLKDDPRITKVGKFIRRYSIDELPQLINVLRGEMSLVGPRPQMPSEVALYEEHVHRRHLVQPGMTGLWQVSGRSNLSWDDTVRLDLYYVENWSISQDLAIMAKTVKVVFNRSGAY